MATLMKSKQSEMKDKSYLKILIQLPILDV